MTYEMYYSSELEKRLRHAHRMVSVHIEGDPNVDSCIEALEDVIPDIGEQVCEGDTILFADTDSESETDDDSVPRFEFVLHVSDKYLGEFEFEGLRLKGNRIEFGNGLPVVEITITNSVGVDICLCMLPWVTIGNDAEDDIQIGYKHWSESEAEWKKLGEDSERRWEEALTHTPVFSRSGAELKEYIVTLDDDAVLEEEFHYNCFIRSENAETAIYDFLREQGPDFWALVEEGDSLLSERSGSPGGEEGRAYVFALDSASYVGTIDFEGRRIVCIKDEYADYPHLISIHLTDTADESPIAYISELMPKVIAEENIRNGLKNTCEGETSEDL